MTDENLNLLISALSTPCWDLSDKTRLEFLDMARELKQRRSAEKEHLDISIPPSDKNPAGAICKPLRELFAAREKLKSLPEPCTAFKNNGFAAWLGKLNEEVNEVADALIQLVGDEKNHGKIKHLLRELCDVSTVVRSMEYSLGYSANEIAQMQCWVNNNNRERGYMDEPERQTDSHEKGKD